MPVRRTLSLSAVPHGPGHRDAPALTPAAPSLPGKAEARIVRAPKQAGPGPAIRPEDALTVALYLTRLPFHELWSGGRPLLAEDCSVNSLRVAALVGECAARAPFAEARNPPIAAFGGVPGIVDPVLAHLAAALLAAFTQPGAVNPQLVDHVSRAAHAHLADKYSTGRRPERPSKRGLTATQLRRAKELLADSSNGNILLADIARECGLSRQYFSKAFKEATGITPHRWLQQFRVAAAKRLLRETALPIAEIAITCGFADQSHLTRVFTAFAGIGPAAWRRRQSE
jgi:AraC-like DNA-binding protein